MNMQPQDHFDFNLEEQMWQARIKSINELSLKTGISRPALSAWKEGNVKMLNLNTLQKLCKTFDCQINDLISLKR